MPSTRTLAVITLALAGGILGSCGPGTSADVTQIKQVITGFSQASGPSACNYLTTGALDELYAGNGHVTQDRRRALATCAAKAAAFKGEPVEIGRVWFPHDALTASAYAHGPSGHPRWQLFLHKVGGRWQIAHIQH